MMIVEELNDTFKVEDSAKMPKCNLFWNSKKLNMLSKIWFSNKQSDTNIESFNVY